jgi:hypothetical protein
MVLISFVLTACDGQLTIDNGQLTINEPEEPEEILEESEETPEEPEEIPDPERPTDPEGREVYVGWDMGFFPLIAMLPEENMYFYGISYPGVILYHDGYGRYFNWSWVTPHMILPRIMHHDFDGCGEKEVALIFHVGSGTMTSMYDLHILQMTKGDWRWEYTVHSLTAWDIKDWFTEPITVTVADDNYSIAVSFNGENHTVENVFPERTLTDEFYYGNIVVFQFTDTQIQLNFLLFVPYEEGGIPLSAGRIEADVIFDGEGFRFENLVFTLDN